MQKTSENADILKVLEKISHVIELDRVTLVGARCRNFLNAQYSKQPPQRRTNDIDLALAADDWATFQTLKNHLSVAGQPWQQIKIDGLDVDIVPFGDLEDPAGLLKPRDGLEFTVTCFQEVFNTATSEDFGGLYVKIPSPAGFVALKLHAHFDRWRTKPKDASDLALVLSWYEDCDDLWDRFPNDDDRYGEIEAMAAWVLGDDIAPELGPVRSAELALRFESHSARALADHLSAPPTSQHPPQIRTAQVQALHERLSQTPGP